MICEIATAKINLNLNVDETIKEAVPEIKK